MRAEPFKAVCIGGPADGQVHTAHGPIMSVYETPAFEPLAIAGGVEHYEQGAVTRHQYYALCWRADKTHFDRFVWVHNALTKDEALHKLIDFYGNR